MGHDHAMTETETTELKKSLAELKQGLVSLAAMLNKHFPALPVNVCGHTDSSNSRTAGWLLAMVSMRL